MFDLMAMYMEYVKYLKFRNTLLEISEGSTKQVENEADTFFFSKLNTPKTIGGKASLQPKRTPVSNQEMEAILVSNFSG